MHRRFRELLPEADGRNEWVAAINADIRGFSSVMSGDPAQTALYLKGVYARILDNFFLESSFFKPTGDGLLLVVPFRPTESELARVSRDVVEDALRLFDSFTDLIADDKMIRFPHPKKIGIGVAVGSVSRLAVGDVTLDYTGRPLNVASRLMDLARPGGVVLESTLDFDALEAKARKRFSEDHVYLKGVADQDGVDILYTSPGTEIPERYRRPLRKYVAHSQIVECTLAEARHRGIWLVELDHAPADRNQITMNVVYPEYRSGKRTNVQRHLDWETFDYLVYQNQPTLRLRYGEILENEWIKKQRLPAREKLRVEIYYPFDPDDDDT